MIVGQLKTRMGRLGEWVIIFRRVGAYGPTQPERGWQPVLQAHEYSVYSCWWSGWMVEHWRFFLFSERHSFRRLTVPWASQWQGIMVLYFFLLILHVPRSVDFSKSVLDRHPSRWQRPGDAWRVCAWQRTTLWINSWSWWDCLHLLIWVSLLEPWWRGGPLPAGKVMGSLLKPLYPGATWRNHLQRTENNPELEGFEWNKKTCLWSNWITEWRRSETWAEHFFSLGASQRHFQIWLRKPKTISGGIYHPNVLCPLM